VVLWVLGGFQLNELEMADGRYFRIHGANGGKNDESCSGGSSGTTTTQTNPTAGPKSAFGRRFWCFYSSEGQKKKIENAVVDMRGIRKIFSPINQDFSWPTPKKHIYAKKYPKKSCYFGTKSPLCFVTLQNYT